VRHGALLLAHLQHPVGHLTPHPWPQVRLYTPAHQYR
jgi:hypothetical protein